jgi:hypothetical protein
MSNNNSIIGPLIGLGFGLIALKTLKTITAPKETRRPLDKKQIAIGTKVEMEHTSNPTVAREIAIQHLREYPDYYSHLIPMERKLKAEWKRKGRFF